MPIDLRQCLIFSGYAFALAAMAYSLIGAFATRRRLSPAPDNPEVSPHLAVLKPLCGADPETYECLRSFCEQAYPKYQVVFGVSDPLDPAVAIVHRLQREFPRLDLVLSVARSQHGSHRKVTNLIHMIISARHDYLIVSAGD